jgi:hypothetical protein
MRRGLTVGVILLLVLGAGSQAVAESRRERQCRFQWMDKATWTPREEWRTASCVTTKWAVPGGLSKLRSVGTCESGWNRLALNPAGPYLGIFQHASSSWSQRVATYEPEWWNLDPRWTNSRTQITVTTRMASLYGWGAWTCA